MISIEIVSALRWRKRCQKARLRQPRPCTGTHVALCQIWSVVMGSMLSWPARGIANKRIDHTMVLSNSRKGMSCQGFESDDKEDEAFLIILVITRFARLNSKRKNRKLYVVLLEEKIGLPAEPSGYCSQRKLIWCLLPVIDMPFQHCGGLYVRILSPITPQS